MEREGVGDLMNLVGPLTQEQANKLEYFNQMKEHLKSVDKNIGKAEVMASDFGKVMRNGMDLIAADERRIYETSGTFVKHQLVENAASLMGSTYMSNPAGSMLNQLRGGSYYNVENDLLSLVIGFGADAPGAYERSLISDSKGLLSLIPDTPLPSSTAGKIVSTIVPGAWETQAMLYGMGNIPGMELKQDTKFTTSGEGLHSLDQIGRAHV